MMVLGPISRTCQFIEDDGAAEAFLVLLHSVPLPPVFVTSLQASSDRVLSVQIYSANQKSFRRARWGKAYGLTPRDTPLMSG